MPIDLGRKHEHPSRAHNNNRPSAIVPAPRIRAALQSDGCLEVLLFEAVGDDGWGGGVTAKQIKWVWQLWNDRQVCGKPMS